MISTPCTKICVIENGLCIGCGRTLGEIAAWGSMHEAQRREIMRALPARLTALDAERQADQKPQADHDKKDAERDFKLPPRP